VISIGRLGPLG